MILKDRDYPPDSWTTAIENLLPSLFHPSIQPEFVSQTNFCEHIVTFGGSWQPHGYGSFLPNPLIANMFRAVVYKSIGWKWKPPVDHKLSAFFLQRGGKRSIINSDELYTSLVQSFNHSVYPDFFTFTYSFE